MLADGEGQEGKARAFAYDVTNRLAGYSKDGALRASYRYNAFGQRVTKTLYGREEGTARTLNFAYTPEGWLLSEIGRKHDQEAGSASDWETRNERLFTDEYIWLGGRPLAKLTRKITRGEEGAQRATGKHHANGVTKKAEVSYLHTDHLATPRRATNDNGQTVWQWNSDAYGAKRADRDPDGDGIKTHVRLRFPGQYYDGESGLHYNHHRDYDPKLGRYIQSDPIGLWGGINRYAYVGGNPVNWIDPMGLKTCTGSRIKRAANYNCASGSSNLSCVGSCGSFYGLLISQPVGGGGSSGGVLDSGCNTSGCYTVKRNPQAME